MIYTYITKALLTALDPSPYMYHTATKAAEIIMKNGMDGYMTIIMI